MPLNELLLCAAFTEDGIPKRPTHQPPRRIRVTKRRESSPKKKRPPRGPQPPVTMSTVFEGPSLPAAQSTISLSQPQPERRRGTYCPQDAIEPAQRNHNPYFYGGQSQQLQQTTQVQAENQESPFPANSSCDGRKYGSRDPFSDRTNASVMGMQAQLMSSQQFESQPRACLVLHPPEQYDFWFGMKPDHTVAYGYRNNNVLVVCSCLLFVCMTKNGILAD